MPFLFLTLSRPELFEAAEQFRYKVSEAVLNTSSLSTMSLEVPLRRSPSEPYYDLGDFSILVSTDSLEAQIWFNRALLWTFCFNHDEAITCYRQAIAHDDGLAVAYWGISFCSGPNYNKTWRLFDEKDKLNAVQRTYANSQEALHRIDNAAPWERALIKALAQRYPSNDPTRDFEACDRAYASAMRDVFHRFGADNFSLVTLFADALMNVTPRKLFDTRDGQPILTSHVLEVRELLETALRVPGVEKHPGVAHMYIHLMEMSATPEVALHAAEMIRNLVPDTGHTYHMPAHIDVLVGDYRRAVEYNLKATIADDKYFSKNGAMTFYSYYRLHDYHSLIYAAMLGGKRKTALDATDRMEATITDELLHVEMPALVNWMEFFKSVRVHVYIRFGMWDKLKAMPLPVDVDLYCVTNVMTHYGKAIAYAATSDVAEADRERNEYHEAAKIVPPTRLDFPNKIVDILQIATAMLDGEIEYRLGRYHEAFVRLADAIRLEDELPFAEPWGWMIPARHAYAALSLEQGHVERAALAYAQDLGIEPTPGRSHQHPNNIWALHGYHECLVQLQRHKEARIISRQLSLAAAEADINVTSSCFCRFQPLLSDAFQSEMRSTERMKCHFGAAQPHNKNLEAAESRF